MSHFLAPLVANLESIVEQGGYIILLLLTILEGVPVIGSFVPGHTVVILSGFLARLSVFNIWAIVFIVIVAAMLGDFSGYVLGKKYGYDFLKRFGKFIFIKDEHIEKAKQIVSNHTGKAIIFGRFNPITRPLIPFIIGASKIHINKFWLFDFIGVTLWSFISIGIGYIFGASYHVAAGIFGKFIIIATLIAILIIWGYRFINKRFNIFAKYELIVLILNLTSLYLFFKTVQDTLKDHAFMAELDVWINVFFSSHVSSVGLVLMNIVTDILSPTFLSIISLIVIIYLLVKKYWRYSAISILSVGGGLFVGAFIKEVVERARPLGAFITETDFSFPSGHAIMATIFFTLFIYIFPRKIKSWIWREVIIVASVFLIVLTSFSRLYLGVHWFSDVAAGCAFGLFWVTLMILFVRYLGLIVKSLWYKN